MDLKPEEDLPGKFHEPSILSMLPGGCTYAKAVHSGTSVDLEFNNKRLCPAQIFGIAFGVFVGLALIVGGAFYFLKGTTTTAPVQYVSL